MNRIKSLRAELGWTQTDLATRISAVKSTISRYESETAKLDPGTIEKLCRIFDCSADYLLGLSTQRTLQISDSDAEILAAYKRAPGSVRAGIDALLEPYKAKKEAAGG